MESDGTAQSRLIITEMVLENFKSYAGEQRVGPFHKVCALNNQRNSELDVCILAATVSCTKPLPLLGTKQNLKF
jgi:hypothetical protein